MFSKIKSASKKFQSSFMMWHLLVFSWPCYFNVIYKLDSGPGTVKAVSEC